MEKDSLMSHKYSVGDILEYSNSIINNSHTLLIETISLPFEWENDTHVRVTGTILLLGTKFNWTLPAYLGVTGPIELNRLA